MEAPLHLDICDAPDFGRAFWAETSDQRQIRYAHWTGADDYVLILPGRTEYIEKYGRVVAKLVERNFGVIVLDWRNQGLSDRVARTGHVTSYAKYQMDLEAVFDALPIARDGRALHVIAHSMGGLIGLGALRRGMQFQSAIFSGPMWGMGLHPLMRSTLRSIAGIAVAVGLGKARVFGTSRGSYIRDADPNNNTLMASKESAQWVQAQLKGHPELALGGPSWAWLDASHEEIRYLEDFDVPDLPTLTLIGDNETVVDVDKIQQRMAVPSSGQLVVCEGAKHEVLMETGATAEFVWAEMEGLWARCSAV